MPLHLLLDAARAAANTETAKELNPSNQSLYREKEKPVISLDSVAPHLFTFQKDSAFVNWFFENGWGDAWGLLVQSDYPFEELYRHFRRFIMVKTEDGEELYFRFYDPRVLRIFLPTCDAKQLLEFFGPVNHFICEDEDAENTLIFSLKNNQLKIEKTITSKLFPYQKKETDF